MPRALPNIDYIDQDKNPTIDSGSSMYMIPYFKDYDYFSNIESRNNFIKGCEKLVRTNDRYNKYISYLKKQIKLNKCQFLSNLTDEDCSIEMHHGPIFTLYDICDIVLDYYIRKKWKITTFRIADTVLEEHRKNRIQVVMLSTTVHEEVHDREIFINVKQAWGDINAFVKKYGPTFSEHIKEKYNKYLDKCLVMDSDSYDILKVNEKVLMK